MSIKTATVVLANDDMRFTATAGSGHAIVMDSGRGDAGMRPAELVPIALAGCTAMDVVSILRKKRQPFTAYEARATGVQREEPQPAVFTRIDIVHVVDGDVETAAVRRAIELSATKYCSVGATLASGITEVHHGYLIRRPGQADEAGEVLVEGPLGVLRIAEAVALDPAAT